MSDSRTAAQFLLVEAESHLIADSLPRLKKCLAELTDAEIWQRPNTSVVSVGNLILHLCGNVRQWIISGLGGAKDTRERSKEFDEKGPLPRAELISHLESTLNEAAQVLRRTNPATLTTLRRVQGYEKTGLQIVFHVCEHFSYHVGQISLHVKLIKNKDLGYFAGRDLNVKG